MQTPTTFNRGTQLLGKALLFAAVVPLLPAIGLMWLVALACSK